MSDVIITVSNLGKKYRISHQAGRQRYTALRSALCAQTPYHCQNLTASDIVARLIHD